MLQFIIFVICSTSFRLLNHNYIQGKQTRVAAIILEKNAQGEIAKGIHHGSWACHGTSFKRPKEKKQNETGSFIIITHVRKNIF